MATVMQKIVFMAFLLLIDTASDNAFVGFANSEGIIAQQTNNDQKDHASFLQPAISRLMLENNINLQNIDAVAVVNGPGSYTGLRVGLASAKGLCYVLKKPLILLNTLEVMALASIEISADDNFLHCPMIDARRMEVFTGVYKSNLQPLMQPAAMVLAADSFDEFLKEQPVIFSGSGAEKFIPLIKHTNAKFLAVKYSIKQANTLAQSAFYNNNFADLAYSEPFYLKNFYIFSR